MLPISAVTLVVLISCVEALSIDMPEIHGTFLSPNSLTINRHSDSNILEHTYLTS